MANILDYLQWRGDILFSQVPMNEIDALILARVAYFPFDDILQKEKTTIQEAYQQFEEKSQIKRVLQKEDLDLFPALANSRRYQNLILTDYINFVDKQAEKQFSAVTILIPNQVICISYRGTDNTLIGWKEDFNLSFTSHVPSQIDASNYLNMISSKYKGNIVITGHSKGGNLAVYAATFCKQKYAKRIIQIYNEDGPGFDDDIIQTPAYQRNINKVHTYIPQSSIIGRLLNHPENYTIVTSTASGLLQHDLYTWQLLGNQFMSVEQVTNGSELADKTIKQWLKTVAPQEREEFIDTLFTILNSTQASTLEELSSKWFNSAKTVLTSYKNIDAEKKKMITKTLHSLLKVTKENLLNKPETTDKTKLKLIT